MSFLENIAKHKEAVDLLLTVNSRLVDSKNIFFDYNPSTYTRKMQKRDALSQSIPLSLTTLFSFFVS